MKSVSSISPSFHLFQTARNDGSRLKLITCLNSKNSLKSPCSHRKSGYLLRSLLLLGRGDSEKLLKKVVAGFGLSVIVAGVDRVVG
jgi:hypothetical protein